MLFCFLGTLLPDRWSSHHHTFIQVFDMISSKKGIPWRLRRQSTCLQCGRPRFDPSVRKILWRRKWQATPVLLPGKSHGQRSMVGYSPWGRKELDIPEQLHFHFKENLTDNPGLREYPLRNLEIFITILL